MEKILVVNYRGIYEAASKQPIDFEEEKFKAYGADEVDADKAKDTARIRELEEENKRLKEKIKDLELTIKGVPMYDW